ncbi:hypothetical protein L1987_54163 [Smallanthus sonchifolius]|uniref:Uncharacterized protein n=1 Tax=Smallanthus sonchifolius TaxID=185202 RepID=A0ACB9E6A3_9ASTR|nr:hypothetical protein L1987_54163 [Smallanthus sonchifolius]
MVDSNIRGAIFPKCLRRFVKIAYDCLLSVPKERPTMTEVVASLQALLELQQKHDNSANSPGTMGFTWMINKYFPLKTKQNSDQSTSSSTNMHDGDQGEMPQQDGGDQHGELVARDLKIFTYNELECASRDIRKASLYKWPDGVVYKGWVDKMTHSPCKHKSGLPIAIKRLDSYDLSDLDMLKEFCHPNIVKVIGYCIERKQLFLVHEFMSNGNLEDLLCSGAIEKLPLVTKVKIIVGIAQAFLFMHENKARANLFGCTAGVHPLHKHNILLDKNFTPKLSDYYISKQGYGFDPVGTDFHYDDDVLDNKDYYYPGAEPFQLLCNLSGFRIVFAEVLTGLNIKSCMEFWKIDTRRHTKWRLGDIAGKCLQVCSEVNAESMMLRFLEDNVD